MQYVFVIYQGFSPIPADEEAWATLSSDEQKAVYADYGRLNRTPGLTPGLPLGSVERSRSAPSTPTGDRPSGAGGRRPGSLPALLLGLGGLVDGELRRR